MILKNWGMCMSSCSYWCPYVAHTFFLKEVIPKWIRTTCCLFSDPQQVDMCSCIYSVTLVGNSFLIFMSVNFICGNFTVDIFGYYVLRIIHLFLCDFSHCLYAYKLLPLFFPISHYFLSQFMCSCPLQNWDDNHDMILYSAFFIQLYIITIFSGK